MKGYRWIPETWKSGIPKIADTKFDYTDFTFKTIVDSTQKRAIALVERNGGRVDGDRLIIKTQTPQAAKLELWDNYGSPVERIAVKDPRWQWKGNWSDKDHRWVANTAGAEASIDFDGTGVIVVGSYLKTGGKAEVHLDGKLDRVIDVYPDEDDWKDGESVWHAFGLKPGKHTVKLVVLGQPYPGSQGSDIAIQDLVVFR